MSPQDPPRQDDNTPENETETSDTITGEDTVDGVEASTNEDAVDAEILVDGEEVSVESTFEAERDDELLDEAEEADTQEKEESGGLAGPFAIIVGALVVIAALVIFLNRNSDTPDEGTTSTIAAQDAATPIDSDPLGRSAVALAENDMVERDDDPETEAPAEDTTAETETTAPDDEATASTETAAPETGEKEAQSAADTPAMAAASDETAAEDAATAAPDDAASSDKEKADSATESVENTTAEEETASNEEEMAAAATTDEESTAAETDTETSASAAETVAALSGVQADESDETAEASTAERRSALIARAAERNRARREARETTAEPSSTTPSTEETTDVPENSSDESTASVPSEDNEQTASETAGADAEVTGTDEAETPADTDERDTSAEEAVATTQTVDTEAEDTAPEDSQPTNDTPVRDETVVADLVEDLQTTAQSSAATPAADLEEFKSDVKADVLAQTEQVIDEKIGRTEREVRALRTEVTEQQRVANERLAALTRKIDTIETNDLSAARQSTLLIALSDLDDNIRAGEPFLRELENLERITPSARSLRSLREYAATGLPTDSELNEGFALAARQALSGAKREDSKGPFSQFMSNISGLFTVRKIGNVEGDTPSAIIARAETQLANNNLTAAADELTSLDGDALEAFESWIELATAKSEAAQRLDALQRSVLADIN